MKICHLTSAHTTGDIRIFKKECVSLAKNTHNDVYLVGMGESRFDSNVHIIGVGDKPSNRIKRIFGFSKKVYNTAININADIYHFHDPELLRFALRLKRRRKIVIFDSHEIYYDQIKEKTYIPKSIRIIIACLYKMLETYVCKRIDAVIVPATKNGKFTFEGRCNEYALIDNTPIVDSLLLRVNNGVYKSPPKVCYIGRISYSRGIKNLIEACNRLGITLVLAGEYQNEDIRKSIEKNESYKYIDYRGYCNKDEIFSIYQECAIGVSILLDVGQYHKVDNLATKVYEYMSAGLPVIINESPYINKITKKYKFALVVDPENIDEISDAINTLINDRDFANSLGLEGKRAVKEQFNWKIDEAKLNGLYEKIVLNCFKY